jgi:hypothetical protein
MAAFSRYAPEFRIRINGEALPVAMRAAISSISYQDGIEGADRVEVSIANPNLRWLDHPVLAVDNRFSLSIGYAPATPEEVFVGEITGVEPSFPSGGMPTIKITAQDLLNRLARGTKDRAFRINIPSVGNFPLPDVAVASIVSATNLLIPYPDPIGGALSVLMTIATYIQAPTEAQKHVPRQNGQSDFDFLKEISRRNGWEMYIDHTLEPHGRILRFQFLMQDYAPSVSLKWGSSLMEFTPRLTTVGDVFGVTARVWVATLKTEFVIAVSWDFDRACFNLMIFPSLIGNVDRFLGPAAARGRTVSVKTTSLAKSLPGILSELLPRLNNRLKGTGSTIGNPDIKAGRVIDLKGLGDQFSGLYRITSATHTLDNGGYRTNFEVRKEIWFGSIPVPKSPSGLLRVQGERVA